MLGNRSLGRVLRALVGKHHYIALVNMGRNYPQTWGNLVRYLSGSGEYPYTIEVRTPLGIVRPKLHSHADLLTVNEIFCRNDYVADSSIRTVVDFGSNIGLSALYFLTRNTEANCYLYEPDKRNVARLVENLTDFATRYTIFENAVSDRAGRLEFGIEPTGRYGGIGVETGQSISVECLNVNDVIGGILGVEEKIDVLKIDTEGVEIATVEALAPSLASRIGKIYIEAAPKHRLHPNIFSQVQYGSICQLTNYTRLAQKAHVA